MHTSIFLPSTTVPCSLSRARSASALFANVTKPNPCMQGQTKQHALNSTYRLPALRKKADWLGRHFVLRVRARVLYVCKCVCNEYMCMYAAAHTAHMARAYASTRMYTYRYNKGNGGGGLKKYQEETSPWRDAEAEAHLCLCLFLLLLFRTTAISFVRFASSSRPRVK